MANIITSGITEADSSEFTLTTETVTLLMGGTADSNARVSVKIKAADGTFSTIGALSKQCPSLLLTGAGTYKLTRAAAGTAFTVDKN